MQTIAHIANYHVAKSAPKFEANKYPRFYAAQFIINHQDLIPHTVRAGTTPYTSVGELLTKWLEQTGENKEVAINALADAFLRESNIQR